ncbi:MAG TPA: hypothetical protein VGM91_08090 [Conexibacter sp.]|jgi:hypothetical protein
MRPGVWIGLALMSGVLALAGPAAAHRVPSADELTAMAGATGPPTDPACVRGLISTLDVRWGALFATHGNGCPSIDRTWVLRRTAPDTPGSRWGELRQGISFGVCASDLPGIPNKVGVDLGVCAPPSRRVYAPSGNGFAFKPARLPYGQSASVTGLRWSSWNGPRAHGSGTFVYHDRYGAGFRVAVTVTLSAIDDCGSNRTYLAKQLTAARPQDRSFVRAYAARWFLQCPGVIGVPGR